jgi:fucose permease
MQTDNWSNAFWLLAIACVVGLVFIIFTPMDETKIQLEKKQPFYKDYKKMLVLLAKFTMWAFLLLAFCYLFIEQGILNFLPIFNVQVLHIPSSASVEVASLLSAGIALGRIMFSFIVKYIHWSKALFICIISALIVLLISLYLTLHISGDAHYTHWNEFPPAAYLLPVVGFMVGPVYPTLCSSILSKQKIEDQSSTTVLIIIFSALGGSAGSILVGAAFNVIGGLQAFAVFMIPLVILLIFVLPYNYLLHNSTGK